MCNRASIWLDVPDLPAGAFQKSAGKLRRLFGGKDDDPQPDPMLTMYQMQALERQSQAMDRYMALEEELHPLRREQLQQSIDQSNWLWEQNKQDREYSLERRDKLTGIQNRILADASSYNEEQQRQKMAAQSDADVALSFGSARDTNTRAMQRMGVNPNDGRSAAMGAQMAASEALARVQGRRIAGDTARAEGRQLVDRAANVMAGYPSMGQSTLGQGTSMMGAGVNAFQTGMSGLGQAYTTTANMAAQMGQGATSAYNAQANYAQSQQSQGDGFGQILGTAVSAMAMFSDRRLKTNIVRVGKDGRTGLNIYEYEFKNGNGQRWRGVMADEVREKYPQAVFRVGEFDAVDYAALGLKVEAVMEAAK